MRKKLYEAACFECHRAYRISDNTLWYHQRKGLLVKISPKSLERGNKPEVTLYEVTREMNTQEVEDVLKDVHFLFENHIPVGVSFRRGGSDDVIEMTKGMRICRHCFEVNHKITPLHENAGLYPTYYIVQIGGMGCGKSTFNEANRTFCAEQMINNAILRNTGSIAIHNPTSGGVKEEFAPTEVLGIPQIYYHHRDEEQTDVDSMIIVIDTGGELIRTGKEAWKDEEHDEVIRFLKSVADGLIVMMDPRYMVHVGALDKYRSDNAKIQCDPNKVLRDKRLRHIPRALVMSGSDIILDYCGESGMKDRIYERMILTRNSPLFKKIISPDSRNMREHMVLAEEALTYLTQRGRRITSREGCFFVSSGKPAAEGEHKFDYDKSMNTTLPLLYLWDQMGLVKIRR